MKYKIEVKVTPELLANTEVNDEYLFRELVHKMIREIPFDELKKLMNFTKTDPNTREAKSKINDYRTPDNERHLLIMLERQKLILYEAEVFLEYFK